jgi:hypothetical protein
MRESYKRFVKTWIRFANPWIRSQSVWICFANPSTVFKDSFRGFVLYYGVQKIRFVDSIRRLFLTGFSLLTRIQRILTNPHESLLHKRTLMEHESWDPDSRIPTVFKRFVSWIRFVLRRLKDSFRGFVLWRNFQNIRFVDSFRDAIFKRFILWIRFVRPKISNYSIRFVSEGFVYESRILTIKPFYIQNTYFICIKLSSLLETCIALCKYVQLCTVKPEYNNNRGDLKKWSFCRGLSEKHQW